MRRQSGSGTQASVQSVESGTIRAYGDDASVTSTGMSSLKSTFPPVPNPGGAP